MMVKVYAEWNRRRVAGHDWEAIEKTLRQASKEGAIVHIKNSCPGLNDPRWLSIEIDEEEGLYLPIISMDIGGPLLYYNNPKATGEFVYFAGGDLRDYTIVKDFDTILGMAREFFETGRVKGMMSAEELAAILPINKPK